MAYLKTSLTLLFFVGLYFLQLNADEVTTASSTSKSFNEVTSSPFPKTCNLDVSCLENQVCKTRPQSRFGVCVCKDGYYLNSEGQCLNVTKLVESTTLPSNFPKLNNLTKSKATVSVQNLQGTTKSIQDTSTVSPKVETSSEHQQPTVHSDEQITTSKSINLTQKTTPETTDISLTPSEASTLPTIRKLIVSTGGSNKTLQLPENKISIYAFALPKAPDDKPYKYEWTLVLHPPGDDTGREEDRHTKKLQLSDLKQGLYTYKVKVSGDGAYGEEFVNITVKPPKRKNKPPVAIISPKNSTISLPNTDAVLDGSQSTDDEGIKEYHWEEVISPIGFEGKLTDAATLQLTDLKAGFYQFRLIVIDSDNVSNSTIANVTVLKEKDYPPVANAGEDVVIFLPENKYVLNGNVSTDDKGIKSWEWIKSPDTKLPVDVQGTQSPYLHLSNLQKGMYKFILKVTDEVGQSGTAEVHIFVKAKKISDAPKVNAGKDIEIDLSKKFINLEGSSTNTNEKVSWHWSLISGPKKAVLENSDTKSLKFSGFTVGSYKFALEVTDSRGQKGSDDIIVNVKQVKNVPPKANAGGDKTVVMPAAVVFLNGSLSYDDRGIKSYKWSRHSSSLAAGDFIENSDRKPVLKLVNLIPGRYIFTLTVSDEQGEKSSDTASLIVKISENFKDEVQITLNVDLKSYTEANKETLMKKLALLLNEGTAVKVKIKNVYSDFKSGRVVIVFSAYSVTTEKEEIIKGTDVVMRLKKKLYADNILDYDIVSLETVFCQNNCSNHGTCEPYSKQCICDAFWMENFIRWKLGDGERNCDWSILYVIVIIFVSVLSLIGFTWALICFCRRKKKPKVKKRHRYTLLDTTDDNDEHEMSKGPIQKSSLMISESDTDSDSLFERSRSKPVNCNGHSKFNGVNRTNRRIVA